MGGSLGGSKSKSKSSAQSYVMEQQIPFLQQLWSSAMNNLGKNDYNTEIADEAKNSNTLLDSLFVSQSDLQQQLAGGGAYGNSQQYIDKLLGSMGQRSNTGTMYESIVGGQGNTYVDPLIDRLRSDSAQNFSTLKNANAMDATMAGQSGSSRQAMQDAMMGSQINRDLSTQEAALRQGAYDTDLALKMGIAKQADSNQQLEQDRLLSMIQGSQESLNNSTGMGSLLQSLASGGMDQWLQAQQASWNPLNNVANIIGNPTILGSGSSSGKSKGAGASGSIWG